MSHQVINLFPHHTCGTVSCTVAGVFQVNCFCSLASETTWSRYCVYLCVLVVSVYLRALLLQADQLSLVQVCSTGVHLGQLSVGVHQLLHRLLWNALPDGSVDALHCLQHCTQDIKRHAWNTRNWEIVRKMLEKVPNYAQIQVHAFIVTCFNNPGNPRLITKYK